MTAGRLLSRREYWSSRTHYLDWRFARSSAHFASDLVEWTDMRHSDGYANLRLRRPA
jgi:hypothetical protein